MKGMSRSTSVRKGVVMMLLSALSFGCDESLTVTEPLQDIGVSPVGTLFSNNNDAAVRDARLRLDISVDAAVIEDVMDMQVDADPSCPDDDGSLPYIDLNEVAQLDGERFTWIGNLSNADNATGTCSEPRAQSNDVVLRFMPPTGGNWGVTTDLDGTEFDTVLYARPSCRRAELEELACGDDITEQTNQSSRIQFGVEANQPTYIITDSYRISTPAQFEIAVERILTLETVELFHNVEVGSIGVKVTGSRATAPLIGLNLELLGRDETPLPLINPEDLLRFSVTPDADGRFVGEWSTRVPDLLSLAGVTARVIDETGLRSQSVTAFYGLGEVPTPPAGIPGAACDRLHGVSTCEAEMLCTDMGCAPAGTECPDGFGVGVMLVEQVDGVATGSQVAVGDTSASLLRTEGTCGGGVGARVYRFIAPRQGRFHFETGPQDDGSLSPEALELLRAQMDTVLFARSHCGLRDVRAELDCNDDLDGAPTSGMNIDLEAGEEIYVFVDGYRQPGTDEGWRGAFELRATPVSPPVLDGIEAAFIDQPDGPSPGCMTAVCPVEPQPILLSVRMTGRDQDRDVASYAISLTALQGDPVPIDGARIAEGPFDSIELNDCGQSLGYARGDNGCFEIFGCECTDRARTCNLRVFQSFEACETVCEDVEPPSCRGGGACPAGMSCRDVLRDQCDPANGGVNCPAVCTTDGLWPCVVVAPETFQDAETAAEFVAIKSFALRQAEGSPTVRRVTALVRDRLNFPSGERLVNVRPPAVIPQGGICDPVGVFERCAAAGEACLPEHDDLRIVPLPQLELAPTELVVDAGVGPEVDAGVPTDDAGLDADAAVEDPELPVIEPAERVTAFPPVSTYRCGADIQGCPARFAPINLNDHPFGRDWVYRGDTRGNAIALASPCDGSLAVSQSVAHFTAPQAGVWRFFIRGVLEDGRTVADTVLMARDSCVHPGLDHVIGCNDDAPGGISAALSIRLEAGESTYLFMGGFGDWAGQFTLQATAERRFCEDHFICRADEGCLRDEGAELDRSCQPAECRDSCPNGDVCDPQTLSCVAAP